MVRHARDLRGGAIGRVRMVQAEFVLGWLSTALEAEGAKQASAHRLAQAGPSGVVGDRHPRLPPRPVRLPLELEAVSADIATFARPAAGGQCHDDAALAGRCPWAIWASMVAAGEDGRAAPARLRRPGIAWTSPIRRPQVRPLNGEAYARARGMRLPAAKVAATRLVAGLPEGFFEAFANLYRDYALHQPGAAQGMPPPDDRPDRRGR